MKTPPVEQTFKMDAATFFGRLNALMKHNPPRPTDEEAVKRFASIGIGPGKAFDLKSLDPAVARGVEASIRDAQAQIVAEAKKPHGKTINGWEVMDNLGNYGTDYLWRRL